MSNKSDFSLSRFQISEIESRIRGYTSTLDLSGLRLKSIPDTLEIDYAKYTKLDCSNNYLKSIDITKFTKLDTLKCNNNLINKLDLCQTNLTTIYCENNKLVSISLPNTICILYCNNNLLTELPSLKHSNLEYLNCSYNKLTQLPEFPLGTSDSHYYININCTFNQIKNVTLPLNKSINKLDCSKNPCCLVDGYTDTYLLRQVLRIPSQSIYA